VRLTLVALAVAVLSVSCGGEEQGSPNDRPRPQERVAAAVTALGEANTGHFASETAGSGGAAYSRFEGDYRLAPPAARATATTYDADGEPRSTEVLAIGPDAWSRDAGSPDDPPCWIHHDVTDLFADGLLVRNGDTYAPAPVAVVGPGRGVYATDADEVTGTTDLGTVLSVVDLSLPSLLGLDPGAGHRMPVTFALDDGVLTGWKALVRDAVERLRELRGRDAAGEVRITSLAALGGAITTQLSGAGDEIGFAPPAAGEVVEYAADPAELAARLTAC
jgi:hypothetical protein